MVLGLILLNTNSIYMSEYVAPGHMNLGEILNSSLIWSKGIYVVIIVKERAPTRIHDISICYLSLRVYKQVGIVFIR